MLWYQWDPDAVCVSSNSQLPMGWVLSQSHGYMSSTAWCAVAQVASYEPPRAALWQNCQGRKLHFELSYYSESEMWTTGEWLAHDEQRLHDMVAALEGIAYNESGLNTKPKANMNDHFDMDFKNVSYGLILQNTYLFRKINGFRPYPEHTGSL